MKPKSKTRFSNFVIVLMIVGLSFTSCSPGEVAAPEIVATGIAVDTAINSLTVTPTVTSTATPIPLPEITLNSRGFYFSVDGRQSFFFARNPTGKEQSDFDQIMTWAESGGTKLVRVHLTHGWWDTPWITSDGKVNEAWAKNWDRFFDDANANGIYILPVFAVWADWNNGTPDFGAPLWQYNPLNSANGGVVDAPGELFQQESKTQEMWMRWLETLVTRWQDQPNIVAWEVFSEINLASGAPGPTDAQGAVVENAAIDFTNQAADIIHAIDPKLRPITVSLAGVYRETEKWAEFYDTESIDFIEIHPYTGSLDRELVSNVDHKLSRYNKPVLIAESGLSAASPNSNPPTLTTADKASVGIRHAIWAGVVSGAMDGRALWHEDGYSIFAYNRVKAFEFMQQYAETELPAARFVEGLDFSGFKPLTVLPSEKVWGAAVGNEKSVVGWFRDAKSEPPNWDLLPVISGESVYIQVPGSAVKWKVDFYDTKTGADIIGSTTIENKGGSIVVNLPDFNDDIAFKMTAIGGIVSTSAPVATTDAISGAWSGIISNTASNFSTLLNLSIQPGCEVGKVCGTFSAPKLPCSGELLLQNIEGEIFVFIEQNTQGASFCVDNGYEYLQLDEDGTLTYEYAATPEAADRSKGVLTRP